MLNATQASGLYGIELAATQHGTSGRVIKPAKHPGLPLVDRNEQPWPVHPCAGPLTSGAPRNPSPYDGRSRVRGTVTDSLSSLFATLPEGWRVQFFQTSTLTDLTDGSRQRFSPHT